MEIKIVLDVKGMDKEDIRAFIQMIRDWELRTPKAEIVWVGFDTDPEISTTEAKAIFEGLYRKFDHQVELPEPQPGLLRLGRRGILVDGKLVGTCDELTLSIAKGSDVEIQALQEARTISLTRIGKG